ncbi:carbon monoxide dehydrogenase [Paraclostridium sp. AKS73]|uniref:carbon monoxide dehydrogenase n=1 Tax=Paraclostridium sp. AKS73 TaxID=2876116 RepID=UPI0021DFCD35|nr:carbon monoxide dehydrogenase [Paraclostridium sp. AKS73]MCU9815848.1 carbon monoxide dehydrogenase [Paraclostridium sp. AKS73]
MKINGENKCFQCGKLIKWYSYTRNSEHKFGVMNSIEAEVIAIGSYMSSNGNSTKYEVIVECKHCGIKNKFEI